MEPADAMPPHGLYHHLPEPYAIWTDPGLGFREIMGFSVKDFRDIKHG
jgi:hypothetical protein